MVEFPRLYRVIGAEVRPGIHRAFIVIRRRPSELAAMSARLDLDLLKLAGAGRNDGPERLMMWEFILPEKLVDAFDLLKMRGWCRVDLRENEITMDYDVICHYPKEVLRRFETQEEAEEYINRLMLGEVDEDAHVIAWQQFQQSKPMLEGSYYEWLTT